MKKVRNDISAQGFVKIPRSILYKGWIVDSSVVKTYLVLMLLANYESTSVCKRGTVGYSLTEIGRIVGADARTIKKNCEVLGFKIESDHAGTQIIIPNYDETQGIKQGKKSGTDTTKIPDTKEEVKEDTPDDEEDIFHWDDDEEGS